MESVGLEIPPVERAVNGKTIRLQKGDLMALSVDGAVYYAREDLQLGSGFGTAIQTRGGAAVKKELEKIGRVAPGEAVVSGAGNMQPRHIIHTCGPKFHEPETETKLRKCIQSALQAANDAGLKTVAFPPMGTGFYGVPFDMSATVLVDVARRFLERESSIQEVIVCVMDDREFRAFRPKLEAM
jgi:O-acetyl-ADP-ribose deacetylase